ncbi:MAG: ATP-binding cassette domain-containing protein [Smithellaceae bacterium]
MTTPLIKIDNLQICDSQVCAEIGAGELAAVIGPNKSGKTMLADILRGEIRNFAGTVSYSIDLRQIAYSAHSADNTFFHYSDFYYQQRYNTFDVAAVDTVEQHLQYDASDSYRRELFNAVLPQQLLKTKIIELSSGETRKVLLLQNLFKEAKIHILDNPFSGLDEASTLVFAGLFRKITSRYGKTIILLLNDNPLNIEFNRIIHLSSSRGNEAVIESRQDSPSLFFTTPPVDFRIVLQIENEVLKIGERTLINNLNWTIKKGEKWLLQGANGSGKSTLLSLLAADNPIAYRYNFSLFDRKRGSGESIWDIKAKIGFISSEIQLYFKGSHSVQDIILSGFSDTMVLNRRISAEEEANYHSLLEALELKCIENAPFGRLSSGEKKTVMIARALVKNPPVLILDEPFQDLDSERFHFLHQFLAQCADEERTVIQTTHHDYEALPGVNRIALIEKEILSLS